jgi:hypothetical protein
MTRFDFDVIGDQPAKPLPDVQVPNLPKPPAPPPMPPERPRDAQAQDVANKAA